MNTNITQTEWNEVENRVAEELARRWPWLCRTSPHFSKLRVESQVLAASAELAWSFESANASVRIMSQSSSCISGGLPEIAEAARQIAEVRDAMLCVHGMVAGLTVWRDGECPCDYCSGKGTSQGARCSKCEGRGKR